MGFGDEIMATGEAARAQQSDARPVAVLDKFGNPRWHVLFENNPRIVRPGSLKPDKYQAIVNGSSARPYIAGKTAQRWNWKPYGPEPGEIYLSRDETLFGLARAGYVLLEPNVKERDARNKNWGWDRWLALLPLLKGVLLAQVGPLTIPKLPGVRHIVTASFREACAVMAYSKAFVGTEGGLHHAAAAFDKPAVVIFGGFISPEITGYESQRNLYIGGAPCGSRLPCQHCREAMHKITPEIVAQNLRGII